MPQILSKIYYLVMCILLRYFEPCNQTAKHNDY